ncbi:MAG: hypothetical protein JNJ60_15580, partial [Rhodocyclaceae bacterium]|nr:hypothetical protein [Rhodocyclaceae bacterium]
NGQTVRLRVLSSAGYLAQTSATVTIGGVSGTFNVTTAAMDTTPNAFSFNPVTTALPNALVTSGSATISGINAATPISVSGGEYSISGGAFTSASGSISSGQTVRVRLTASPAYSSQTSATLSIGGVSATFYVTTVAEDSTPNAFTFRDSTGQALSTLITSTTTTISGINADTSITISGGEYSVNNGPFTSAPGTIQNGKGVRVRLLSSANYSTTTSATVTIGGVSGTFNVTTAAADSTPDAFSFTAVTNAALNTLVISNGITVWGTNAPSDISVTNGEYSIGSGAYTSAPGTVVKGQTVRIRIRTSSDPATTTGGTLTIGGVSATFNATTAP